MIHIIEGNIGAGKTYYVVSWILERYFTYSDRYFEYMPKLSSPKIFTNIAGLKLPDVHDITLEVKNKGGLKNFFSVDKITYELLNEQLRNSVIIIDEAQGPSWFPRKYYDPDVMFFFQYHRHFGCEIFLVTQDVKSLCPELRELPEYYISAVRQSLHIGPYFRYKKKIQDDVVGNSVIKKDANVFSVYNSVTKDVKPKKVPTVLFKYAILFAVAVSLIILSPIILKKYIFNSEVIAKTDQLKKDNNHEVKKNNINSEQSLNSSLPNLSLTEVNNLNESSLNPDCVEISKIEVISNNEIIYKATYDCQDYFIYRNGNNFQKRIKSSS